jgi:hypothetical protein
MRTSLCLAAAVTLVGCARGPNITTAQLPLHRVVIYRNGVGYFERSGHVDTDEVTFKMRQRMVGDFLATLAIVERGGSSVRSASFPLQVDDDKKPVEHDSRFESMLKPWPKPEPETPKEKADKLRQVVLRLDGNEHDLNIGYIAETPVWRPSYRVVVEDKGAELQAWGIVQNLSGEDWKGVKLTLVAGAPLAFQSTLGTPVIPTRPVVTDTGEVITSMPGSETSLRDQPKQPVERYGPGAPPPPPAAAAPAPAMLSGAVAEKKEQAKGWGRGGGAHAHRLVMKATNTRAPEGNAEVDEPAPSSPIEQATKDNGLSAPRNLNALAAVALEAGTTRYEIPNAVTIPDKSATMVLLMNRHVPGEAVYLYAPDPGVPASGSHPFRVVRFTNATRGLLERGPIAVFEKGAFLGQGIVDSLPPGATATVPFALERSLAIDTDTKYDEAGARLHRIESGTLTIDRDRVTDTIYKIKNGGDRAAKVLIKHPRQAGSRLYKPPPGTEDNTGTGSALVPVTLQPYGRVELTVEERQSFTEAADWLSPLADEAVKAYINDPRADRHLASQLAAAWKVRETLKKAVDEQNALETEQNELERDAAETRSSLKAIEKNRQAADLRAKLTHRLGEVTSRLERITKRKIEVGMTVNEAEVRFRDAIHGLSLSTPLPPKN